MLCTCVHCTDSPGGCLSVWASWGQGWRPGRGWWPRPTPDTRWGQGPGASGDLSRRDREGGGRSSCQWSAPPVSRDAEADLSELCQDCWRTTLILLEFLNSRRLSWKCWEWRTRGGQESRGWQWMKRNCQLDSGELNYHARIPRI